MRAVVLTGLDGPGSVEVREVAGPAVGAGQLLVEVHAAGVAFPEVLMSRGQYQIKPELPYVMGSELSGTVREAPAGSGFAAGDRVAALSLAGGAMAELAVVPVELTVPLPESMSLDGAAGLLFNDGTVHFALARRGRLAKGETVLVHGAAGGIGTSVLRMAKALGAERVIAVVSTEEKKTAALAAGADAVALTDDWLGQVRELTDGAGVDIIVDPVGGDRFTDSLRALATGGRVLVVGFTEGSIPAVKVNRLLLNNIEVVGVGWGAYFATHPGFIQQQWEQLAPLYASGAIAEPVVSVHPAEELRAVLERMDARRLVGKAVVTL